jgi:hypothetical protein
MSHARTRRHTLPFAYMPRAEPVFWTVQTGLLASAITAELLLRSVVAAMFVRRLDDHAAA